MQTSSLEFFLWQTLAIFLLIGALSGILLSLLLIFNPPLLARVNQVANQWVSTRHTTRLLDHSISIEHWLYQRHRPLGMLITFGSCYILVYFGLLFDRPVTLQRLAAYMPAGLVDLFLDALVLAALVGAAVALIVGLFFWWRPSLLRGIEAGANQWISLRRATRELEIPRDEVEQFVAGHAKRVGWLLLLGSIYLFLAILRILM